VLIAQPYILFTDPITPPLPPPVNGAQIDAGEILATTVYSDMVPGHRNLFGKERARVVAERWRREMDGAAWVQQIDARTGLLYWHNTDTGQSMWDKPKPVFQREAYAKALVGRYNSAPHSTLVKIASFLPPWPDRVHAGRVCSAWAVAASDPLFNLEVLPVEASASASNSTSMKRRLGYASLSDALAEALAGDTIVLDAGHHWEKNLVVNKAVKIIGQWSDASRVILEMTGSISWRARAGVVTGLQIRRPRRSSNCRELLQVALGGKLFLANCNLNNDGASEGSYSIIVTGKGSSLGVDGCFVEGSPGAGFYIEDGAGASIAHTDVRQNGGDGVQIVSHGTGFLYKCRLLSNQGAGISIDSSSLGRLEHSESSANTGGVLQSAGTLTCRRNSSADLGDQQLPEGFHRRRSSAALVDGEEGPLDDDSSDDFGSDSAEEVESDFSSCQDRDLDRATGFKRSRTEPEKNTATVENARGSIRSPALDPKSEPELAPPAETPAADTVLPASTENQNVPIPKCRKLSIADFLS
jgi:hypothetical protein